MEPNTNPQDEFVDAVQSSPDGEKTEEVVLVSAIEHFLYCPRQCALIHLEQTFDENIYTLRGRHFHQRVDEAGSESEGDVRIERGLPLWSDRLGLSGRADIVEFHNGVPYPVDYKHGRKKRQDCLDAQLCAQSLCLEEMLGCSVPRGAIYHISSKRRREVEFDQRLRRLTTETILAVREMLLSRRVPEPADDARCRNCSLIDGCMPHAVAADEKVKTSLQSLFSIEGGVM